MIDCPVQIGDIQLPIDCLAEADISEAGQVGVHCHAEVASIHIPEIAAAIVGEEVATDHVGVKRAAIDVAAGNGTALAVAIFEDGEVIIAHRSAAGGIIGMVAFVAAPAVVFAPG